MLELIPEATQVFFSLLKLVLHWLLVMVLKDFLRSFYQLSMMLKTVVLEASSVNLYLGMIYQVLVLNCGPIYYCFL